ncbi:MAG: hypothetical protein P9M02_01070 [Candidatus Susulua stagnicola]|nr:hypothetical protein [Candidatus Susulua stagnicola]
MKISLDINKVKDLYSNKKYNLKEVSEILGVSFWSLYRFMNKNNISRRRRSEANYVGNKYKLHFEVKDKLTEKDRELKIAGIMLYWAEGSKNLKSNMLDFVNSDPDMIKLFLKFLRQICGVKEGRLRVYLYSYSSQEIDKLKDYWSRITGISRSQFLKPYVREGNLNLSGRKLLYGLVHIRYCDKRLLELVLDWIKEFKNDILTKWAGTQVAKGDRLCKTQRLAERQDGKVGEFREALSIFNDKGNPEPSSKSYGLEKVQRLSRKGVA